MKKTASNSDYQSLASEWKVGDLAIPMGLETNDVLGRVEAVWPAIGMVDIRFPDGTLRYPVEDIERIDPKTGTIVPPSVVGTPGGLPMAEVSGGPVAERTAGTVSPTTSLPSRLAVRVARRHVEAVYWANANRLYRATKAEQESKAYRCGRKGCDGTLRPASYKMEDGRRVRLLGCPKCLFLIKPQHLDGCHMAPPAPDEEVIENIEEGI